MRPPVLKQLEVAWRRLVIHTVNASLRGARRADPPDWDARPYRVLFLRHDKIGDMIVSTGAIRAIATAHPNILLDVLASPSNAPVLAGTPHVRDVVVFDRRRAGGFLEAARRLREARYDCVVDCMVTAPSVTTLLLMVATGAPYRVGIAGRGNDAAYSLPVPPSPHVHMADQLAALAAAFGVDPERAEHRPRIHLSDDETARAEGTWAEAGHGAGPRLLVNVSSSGDRDWPEARFVEAMRLARARHPALRLLVMGAPSDRAAVERIAAAGAGAVATPPLRDAFALVAAADVVLSPDTSIVHAASAFARPVVVVGLSRYQQLWGPYRMPGRYLTGRQRVVEIPAADVAAALDALLAELGIATPAA